MTIKEFKEKHKYSRITVGALMALSRLCKYNSFDKIDDGLAFMRDLGVITKDEYFDLYRMCKETKKEND